MESSGEESGRPHAGRLDRYGTVSTALSVLSDRQLAALVDQATHLGTGIGGAAALLRVEDVPVFVKRVPLTDRERRPEHVRSTANLFQLPTFLHYGVGSVGSGVWRELAAHVMTTNWVLTRQCESFPLLYHWRTLAGPPPPAPTAEEEDERERSVAYWGGSQAVRERLDAIARASASVVLFVEHFPYALEDWLAAQLAASDGALDAACAMVERELREAAAFWSSQGMFHFDADFGNVLTDGSRLYVTDFGLATSLRFALSEAERDFLRRNATHDRAYVVTRLVNWLVRYVGGMVEPTDRNALIRRYAGGERPAFGSSTVASTIARHAAVAAVMNDFYRRLFVESRATPYPVTEIERVCGG